MSRRLAIWLCAILLALVGLGLFAWRPTPVVGVDGASLSYSVDRSFDSIPCQPEGDGLRCAVWDSGMSGTVDYLVDVDWKGCWDAERVSRYRGEGGTPGHRSGCVTMWDHMRPADLL